MNEITFKHKSGKVVITPSFYSLQGREIVPGMDITWDKLRSKLFESSDWETVYDSLPFDSYARGVNTYKLEEKVNTFFSACKGYEQCGEVNVSGVCAGNIYSPFRVMNKIILNHAAMMGDELTYQKIKHEDRKFYERVSPLNTRALLPAPL
jgi:hypothetical protein